MADDSAQEDSDGQGHNPFLVCMRECGLEPLQFNWFRAALRLYNALTQSNSSTARKILHADMQLSSRCDDCWSSHILSAVDGLTQSYLFKERLLKCEPSDVGRFVVDLRERHLDYWTPYSDINPRECNSKCSTYHQWCALPTRRAMVTHSPYTLPRYMLLDLPRDVIRSMARFRLRAHTLRIENVTWTHNTSPTCDLCNAHDVQDEQHVLFHPCTCCLSPKDLCFPFFFRRLKQCVCFSQKMLGQENNKQYFFLHALIVSYEQATSCSSGYSSRRRGT